MRVLNGHALRVSDVAFAPDGRSLASCSVDGTVRVWDVATGTGSVLVQVAERSEFEPRRAVRHGFDRLAFTGDGRYLVCRSATDGMELWDVGARYRRAELIRRGPAEYESELAVTSRLIAANVWRAEPFGSELCLWDVSTLSAEVLFRTADADSFSGLAFDRSERFLATNAGVFDVTTGLRVLEVLLWGEVLRWSPDGTQIAGGSRGEGVQVIDADTGDPVASFPVPGDELPRLEFSARGEHLAVAANSTVQIWDTANWTRRHEFAWKAGRLTCLALSPDGHVAAAGTARGSIVLWDWDV
ncbi:WD domain, G-beta repeat [Gemmata obscuriglobus]|uniref:WD40 repeat domain-containing protein n=1 Tax=Gemmata obscuriglobus TaxID=114 RepID=A0A2Z3H658_9BACT|nr:hypothetical protein [Gemmata obscuriglobus]AWM36440.1 hypothetical protein C1280_05000 [Gemmata obscuriglobus]QEG30939.1 WD domain, G-beta repeat [Gemmata obscuriglobus]VTS10272.1 ribosome assembly protein 4 : Ribosome assembly protein 4 (RSA4) OS=Anabaena variabilis (strain ATCC 29413 / PCC 7937) GN=Ava_1556 PE=4 SV=1: WD40: WD40 [Gemmata obscuriglobus UQM 2246]